ncbi:hypothetical protein NM688_g5627 [Phlebia brevispora]|uniref:Uncharacterized protein n=1 Tax=Phlebia brevispora TaxID=194682 RepID=A0ACC1SSR7_9APHY|nr:hypothetical protein NM688_g5627 [Phlebia brevispora]
MRTIVTQQTDRDASIPVFTHTGGGNVARMLPEKARSDDQGATWHMIGAISRFSAVAGALCHSPHTASIDNSSAPPCTCPAIVIMAASTWSLSVPDRERLIKAAFEAKQFAYNRYSNFRVGAALLTADGQIIKGGTICAERTALVKAVSEGIKAFTALAVVTDVLSPTSPCGICRQFIREFCSKTMPILLVSADYDERVAEGKEDGVLETSIEELLPHSFGPEDLELPRKPQA